MSRPLAAVVALCLITLAIGWWTKARCLSDGVWDGGEEYVGWCYTDVYPLWFAERLDAGAVPYLDHPVEYPVLTGAQMGLVAAAAHALADGGGAVAFFHLTALSGALLLLATVLLLARDGVPPRRLVWFAGAPTLAVSAFMNWDPLAVLLLVLALGWHRAGRDAAAGVALGLGTAAKLFPVLAVPLIALACWAEGRRRDAAVHVGAAAAAWLAVNVPVMIAAPQAWSRFFVLNRERPPDWDSLWFVAERALRHGLDVASVNRWSLALFCVGAIAITVVGARSRPPSRWWELTLPVLAWFLLSNKVYSPQYSLWLLPLLALALPRAAPFAAFAVADLMVFATRFPFLAGQAGYAPAAAYGPFGFAVVVRAVVLAWIIVETLAVPTRQPLREAGFARRR